MHRAVRCLACLAFALCAAAHGQSFDATKIGAPADLAEATWRFTTTDDLRYAGPAFDDSQWKSFSPRVGFKTQGYSRPYGVWWLRLHVHTMPGAGNLALSMVQESYQIYINGKLIGQQGGFPNRPGHTQSVPQLYPVPADAAQSGSMVIAIRAWWEPHPAGAYDPAYMSAGHMLLGDATLVRDDRELRIDSRFFRLYAGDIAEGSIAFMLGIWALALFRAQREHREYLWLGVMALSDALASWIQTPLALSQIPLWEALLPGQTIRAVFNIAFCLFVCWFLRVRVTWWVRAYCLALIWIPISAVCSAQGWIPHQYDLVANFLLSSPVDLFAPLLAIRQLRRGDREAGILLLPLLLLAVADYGYYLGQFLGIIRARVVSLIPDLTLGQAHLSAADLSTILFYLSIGGIMLQRSMRITREQQRTAAELEAGRSVQTFLLGRDASAPGYTVESAYLPAQEVGGDFFQTIVSSDGGLLAVIGDVAGKGLQAAMRVSMLIGAVRLSPEQTPAALLGKLNEVLLQDESSGFTTCLAARLSPDGTMSIANAGHLAPYLNGHELPIEGGLPLGVTREAEYSEQTFPFDPGDTLLLLSDGVTEATSPSGELFGFHRMAETAAHVTAANSLAETARCFGHQDDITVLLIHRILPVAQFGNSPHSQ